MPRIARYVFPGLPYHVVQRGNRRENVFFGDADRTAYLRWLSEYCAFYGVQILAYCLMTNHVHFVAVPATEDAFETTFRALHTRYAMRVNRVRQSTGHVWQGRPFSAVLDEAYLYTAVRYVELNPVRAGMVGKAEEYRWSSAAAHCGLRRDSLLAPAAGWLPDVGGAAGWSGWLALRDDPNRVAVLRRNSQRSLPCGDDAFVRDLERRTGQTLRPAKMGRPRKVVEK
jgi:putative transposase